MRKFIASWLIVTSVLLGGFSRLQAQEEKSAPEDSKAKTERRTDSEQLGTSRGVQKPVRPYRADFLISELEDGKRINSRRYSILLNVGDWNQVKIGTKVPVAASANMFQYMDIGTRIGCRLTESGDDLAVEVDSDFSSLSEPDQSRSAQPVVRQVVLSGHTLVTSGKPVIIGVADDPGSRHQFQLEATVTKLR